MKFNRIRISYLSALFLLVIITITPALAQSENMSGIVYSPVKTNSFFEDPIEHDITTIGSFAKNVRLYEIDDTTEIIIKNAQTNNIKISLGIDLGNSNDKIKSDMQNAVKFAQDYPNTIDSVVVGNDAIAQNQITASDLKEYLAFFDINEILVTSANSPYVWHDNPSLVDKVDHILLYSFDFWEGLDAKQAAHNAILQHDKLQQSYPDKPIVLEIGWPSDGTPIDKALPTEQEQQKFLKSFVSLANQQNISYYIFEYADESWKPSKNGNTSEKHWGIFSEEDRMIKPHITGLFEFETISHTVQINEHGQAQYTPITILDESYGKQQTTNSNILKVTIPKTVSGISYHIADQEKKIETNGMQAILFIESRQSQDISITTDMYYDEIEFSLIPKAFASCDFGSVCYEVNYDDSANDDNLWEALSWMIIVTSSFIVIWLARKFKPKRKRFGEPFVENTPLAMA